MRIGIDVGGTFTDVILVDDDKHQVFYLKTFTTPDAPERGVCEGIERILEVAGTRADRLSGVVHGTTIGTNALIERKGARTGLVTTEGMRDVLEIGRIQRPQEGLYDPTVETPRPLVARRFRHDVPERIGADGSVITPLDEARVTEALKALADAGCQSLAVSLLFSFLHPAHERRIRELAQVILPDVPVSLSSEVAPEFREFERTSTTVVDAYLAPKVSGYLTTLETTLDERFGVRDLRIMQASGGSMTCASARTQCIRTVNSGPAGGVQAATFFAAAAGFADCIGVDMGGTSFDIGLIREGQAAVTSDGRFAGYPVKIPILDVHCIGAGGGSIAWIDTGNALNVGPRSAGADPGPACYGKGGTHPTVTDANVVLGRLNPEYFLGGRLKLDVEAARTAITEHVGKPLGMTVEAAAAGIIRLVNAGMVKGIAVSSIEKGFDIREFALVAFGGAGAVHAVELAREAGCKAVLVPPYAGNLSALGLLIADNRHDFVRSMVQSLDELEPIDVAFTFSTLRDEGRDALAREGVADADMVFEDYADVRFQGQSYELRVPVANGPGFDAAARADLRHDFNVMHDRLYAYGSETEPMEFVNARVVAIGRSPALKLPKLPEGNGDLSSAKKGTRDVFFGDGTVETTIYDRDLLRAGDGFYGPAIVEEVISSTVVPPDGRVEVSPEGILVITRSHAHTKTPIIKQP